MLVDEELIYAFYDAKLPPEVLDIASFEAWRKAAEKKAPKALQLSRDQLMRHDAEGIALNGAQVKDPGRAWNNSVYTAATLVLSSSLARSATTPPAIWPPSAV